MLLGHGGERWRVAKATGLPEEAILDFSSNCSPLPLPPWLMTALTEAIPRLQRLPEVDSISLREALAREYGRFGLGPDWFLVDGGTTPLIHLLPRVLGPDSVVTLAPSYGDYADAAQSVGVAVYPVEVLKWGGERPSLEEVMKGLLEAGQGRRLIFLCNPNNPDGYLFSPGQLEEVAYGIGPGDILVVDESYCQFVGEEDEVSLLPRVQGLPNVCILRSFSKIHGLPGLRLGYLAGHPDLLGRLRPHQLPWSVGGLAQAVGPLLVSAHQEVARARGFCMDQKRLLLEGLAQMEGVRPIQGAAHFFMVRVEQGAAAICRALEGQGILVRDCSNFRWLAEADRYIRISPGLEEENRTLISRLGKLLDPRHRPK